MNQNYIKPDNWSIIEEGFDKERVKSSESILKKIIPEKPFKEVTLRGSITPIKPKWVGGKMAIQNILLKC